MGMNVLIVGNSAREDAIGHGLQKNEPKTKLFFAPGNGGTGQKGENVPIKPTQVKELAQFAGDKNIHLTIVGGEDPLPLGIVDQFRAKGLHIFGPTAAAAQLESSKAFAKGVCDVRGVSTAEYRVCTSYAAAMEHLGKTGVPIVIKEDGLAAGKGSNVCHTMEQAEKALHQLFVQKGVATVVMESFLRGRESSVHALCGYTDHILIPVAWQDHKYAGAATAEHPEGTGDMTGGMGTYGPVPWMTARRMQHVDDRIVTPVLEEMRDRRIPFTGCLFPGLMVSSDGERVLEFNARSGAPETESWMRTFDNPLEAFEACAHGKLNRVTIRMRSDFAVCLILAARGYPGAYEKGHEIVGIEDALGCPDVEIFHAGTEARGGKLYTAGGRVLSVTATDPLSLQNALRKAYEAASCIRFVNTRGEDTKYLRPDIGHQGLSYVPES